MTQPDVQATLQVRFVDDDTLVRTGRALLEVNGHGWVMVPVPSGWAEQVEAVLDAAEDADTISTYVEAAEDAAASAEADRVVVEQAAMSASWSEDRLTVLGATSPPLRGPKGDQGPKGDRGPAGAGTGDVLWSELDPVLDGKASADHQHPWTDIQDKPETYPPESHTHSQSEVEGLEDALAGKASTGHTHSEYATTAQVEARTPEIRTVSSPEQATSPGVLYVVMEG